MAAAGGWLLPGRTVPVAIVASWLLASTLFVLPSVGAKRSAPIRLRENLWATGHFMGKKSTLESSRLAPFPEEKAEPGEILEESGPALVEVLEDAKGLLMRELLKIILQQRLLEGQGGGVTKAQGQDVIQSWCSSYISRGQQELVRHQSELICKPNARCLFSPLTGTTFIHGVAGKIYLKKNKLRMTSLTVRNRASSRGRLPSLRRTNGTTVV
ncbi:hypothetical protein JRQ81_006815 [Phrynocephalus forsythii]|uniref:Uncharacterized protein n=1 Tax=Phrynocephalus forsythii TaxID=171643 RepID=A0A9Q0XFN2_9SAUR|nr:hypothetical protein JRQ81_006815 [Phrynocephalus forsythii]